MAVDLSIPNSIIAAYAQGRQEQFERQRRLDTLAKQQQDEQFRQQQADEAKRQFEENLAQSDKHFQADIGLKQAQFDINKLLASQEFQKTYEATGIAPPGFHEATGTIGPGMLDTGDRMLIGGPETGGMSLPVRSPLRAATETANLQRIITAPKTESEIQVKNAEALAKFQQEYLIKVQEHQNKLNEDYMRPTLDVLADRVGKGKQAAVQMAQTPNGPIDPKLSQLVEEGKSAQSALDAIADMRKKGQPVSESLLQKELTARDIFSGIKAHIIAPDPRGMYGLWGLVEGLAGKEGYDLQRDQKDWAATTNWIKTLNGDKQVTVRQAVANLQGSVPVLEQYYKEWQDISNASEWKVANWANLQKAKQQGGKAGAIAQKLEAQVNDMVSNLAQVYRVGNAPTDESIKLAMNNLSANWSPETMKAAIENLKKNLEVRLGSITNTGPAGVGGSNPYAPASAGGNSPDEIHYDINGNRLK